MLCELCIVFSIALSIYIDFLTPKQPPDRMPNHIRTPHIAKIRLTTHRISISQHALRVNLAKIRNEDNHFGMEGVLNMLLAMCRDDQSIQVKQNIRSNGDGIYMSWERYVSITHA